MKFKDIPQLTEYGVYQVNVPIRYVLDNITKWEEDSYYQLQLNPDFQRGHVWTEEQQIRYMEFLLKGGKSSRVIYFNKPSWQSSMPIKKYDDFVCVDGLQRLTAIMRFLKNEIKVFDTYYKDFEDKLPIRYDVIFNVNNLKTKKEVLQWYIDLNIGGTAHTKEEIDKVKKMMESI